MPAKRVAPQSSGAASSPLTNMLLVGAALSCGLGILVQRGRVAWPPHQLLAAAYTLAGCLALVGPLVLARREPAEGGLGELLWMTGGLLTWIYDGVAVVRGRGPATTWATPLSVPTMGLTLLAVLVAGWRCRLGGSTWSWTNVTGWVLGLFWVGLAVANLVSGAPFGAGSR
jgi:hypothetical protein